MDKLIYLDNAATTFPKPNEVYEVMDYVNRNLSVNSGRGSYKLSRQANEIITNTRDEIAKFLMLNNSSKVIFSTSATMALNQIIKGLKWNEINNVYVSPFEHNAIMRTLHEEQKNRNFKINIIPFDSETFELDIQNLKVMSATSPADLVLVSQVSNVTGFILPIKEIFRILCNTHTITVIDGSQAVGLVKLDIDNYDFLVFAGHKTLYGPFGIAGFIKNTNIDLKEILIGGTGSDSTNLEMPKEMPYKYEAGSYNIQAIAGLNESIKWLNRIGVKNILEKEQELTQFLISELQKIEELELYIPENRKNHVGIVSFTVDEFDSAEFADILDDEFNIAVRTGHHCAPLVGKFLGGQAEEGLIRISLSYFNTEDDIIALKNAILDILRG